MHADPHWYCFGELQVDKSSIVMEAIHYIKSLEGTLSELEKRKLEMQLGSAANNGGVSSSAPPPAPASLVAPPPPPVALQDGEHAPAAVRGDPRRDHVDAVLLEHGHHHRQHARAPRHTHVDARVIAR